MVLYSLAITLGESRMLFGEPPLAITVKGGFFLPIQQIVLAYIYQPGWLVVNNEIRRI